jgi:hypothetical protein
MNFAVFGVGVVFFLRIEKGNFEKKMKFQNAYYSALNLQFKNPFHEKKKYSFPLQNTTEI